MFLLTKRILKVKLLSIDMFNVSGWAFDKTKLSCYSKVFMRQQLLSLCFCYHVLHVNRNGVGTNCTYCHISSCNNVKWLVKCVDEFLLDQSDVNLQRVLFALTNKMRGLYLEEMTKCWWEVVWDKLRRNSLVTVDWTPWCSSRNLDHLNQFLVHESKYISVMYWGFWF